MGREIFVTGGAGYVGSHCVLELLKSNYELVVLDNLSNAICNEINHNSMPEILKRVEMLANKKVTFYQADIGDEKKIDYIFSKHNFEAVVHFAALKAVGESCRIPLSYYRNNVSGTIILLEVMRKRGVKKFIFSSSATVYGSPSYLPIDETYPTGTSITNPYGRTKHFIEEILKDVTNSEKGWCVVSLRYFNPVGAHESGEIGEDPHGIPNNLMPYISQVAVGRLPYLNIFGNDFNTKDGTGVRDYIHIMDLARGHVMALNKILKESWSGFHVFNLGNGAGKSVLEVVKAFEEATGVKIPYKIVERRPGDIDILYADTQKAVKILGWKPIYDLRDMCKHSWKWQSKHMNGFKGTNSTF